MNKISSIYRLIYLILFWSKIFELVWIKTGSRKSQFRSPRHMLNEAIITRRSKMAMETDLVHIGVFTISHFPPSHLSYLSLREPFPWRQENGRKRFVSSFSTLPLAWPTGLCQQIIGIMRLAWPIGLCQFFWLRVGKKQPFKNQLVKNTPPSNFYNFQRVIRV